MVVQTLTKKQAWKENDEWVVVGLKESKSVERGWIVVPDKAKRKPDPPPIEEPDLSNNARTVTIQNWPTEHTWVSQ